MVGALSTRRSAGLSKTPAATVQMPGCGSLIPSTKVFYRRGDNQLMPDLYVGHAVEKGSTPEDLSHADQVVKGVDMALPVDETGCHLSWPV